MYREIIGHEYGSYRGMMEWKLLHYIREYVGVRAMSGSELLRMVL